MALSSSVAYYPSRDSYDFTILILVAIATVAIVVAIGAFWGSPDVGPDELGLLTIGS
jgi:hypothetical protein